MDNQEVEKPEFPNGINSLREKVAELFYADGICCDDKELNTTLKFVVEKMVVFLKLLPKVKLLL